MEGHRGRTGCVCGVQQRAFVVALGGQIQTLPFSGADPERNIEECVGGGCALVQLEQPVSPSGRGRGETGSEGQLLLGPGVQAWALLPAFWSLGVFQAPSRWRLTPSSHFILGKICLSPKNSIYPPPPPLPPKYPKVKPSLQGEVVPGQQRPLSSQPGLFFPLHQLAPTSCSL